MIEVHGFSKHYGPEVAVDNISFSVQQGEILGFLGPNGAGKSTTMKVLTCYLPPTKGTVRVDGLKQNNGPDTLFGKCTTDNTCYWSSEDCADQEAWKKPSAGGSECTCEEVRVGACVDANGFYYCGVSAQACSSAGMWIDAPTLMRTNEAPECFLCRQLEVEGLGVIPDGTITSTPNDTSNPEAPTFFTSDDGNNTAIIASVTVGGVILFCVLLFGIVYIKCLRRPSEKTASDIPLETITDTSANHDIEDLSTDGI